MDDMQCESCAYFMEDEETCAAPVDEDAVSAFYGGAQSCPYYRFYDAYKMVQKQN